MPDDTNPITNCQSPLTSCPSSKTYLILAFILTIFAVAPLFYPGYIQTHSGFISLWNVADLRANWDNWNWTPRLGLNFDALRDDGLLPYYLAAILPLEPAAAVKTVLGLSWLLGSVGLFLGCKNWLGRPGALVAALVYTYLPFHIATVYVRGAWGEALFWGLLPWAMVIGNFSGRWEFGGLKSTFIFLLWFLLGLSQAGLTLWAFILLSVWLLVTQHRRAIWPVGASLLGVLGVIIFFASSPLTVSSYNFADHFLYPFQLFSAFWGTGFSQSGWNDGLPLQLGLPAVGLTFLGGILSVSNYLHEKYRANISKNYFFWLGSLAILILLQFPLSYFFWHLPLFPGYTLADTLTYPWQLLGLAGLCLSVLSGVAIQLDSHLTRLPVFGAIITFIVLSSYPYLEPQFLPITPEMKSGPQAQLGNAQVIILAHNFSVESSAQTAGLPTESITLPMTVYGLPQANQTLRLNVTWQALRPLSEDLKVFVHLVDSQNNVLGQFDGQPQKGTHPTSHWIPGELIEDSYPLTFPGEVPPGPYRVYLGLYNEASGARLPVPGDPEGRVIWDVE